MVVGCNQVACEYYCNGFCVDGYWRNEECPHLIRKEYESGIRYNKSKGSRVNGFIPRAK